MARPTKILYLSEAELIRLNKVLAEHEPGTQIYKRAFALKDALRGYSYADTTRTGGVSPATISNTKRKYLAGGLEYALAELPRAGAPLRFTREDEETIIFLANTPAPTGHARWTQRLLAEKAVENGFVESISHYQISVILRKHGFQLV